MKHVIQSRARLLACKQSQVPRMKSEVSGQTDWPRKTGMLDMPVFPARAGVGRWIRVKRARGLAYHIEPSRSAEPELRTKLSFYTRAVGRFASACTYIQQVNDAQQGSHGPSMLCHVSVTSKCNARHSRHLSSVRNRNRVRGFLGIFNPAHSGEEYVSDVPLS